MTLKLSPASYVHAAAKAICREECAYRGEPACWQVLFDWDGEKYVAVWPNPNCDEPGCIALAWAALSALTPADGQSPSSTPGKREQRPV